LKEAASFGLDHISLYQLSVEKGTPWENIGAEKLSDGYAPYRFAQWYLPQKGYGQYEISNFAKHGKESRHNLNYWLEGEYIGAGPAAAGYVNGTRYKNFGALDAYAKKIFARELPVEEEETLPTSQRAKEAAVLALRTAEGIRREAFIKEYGKTSYDEISEALERVPEDLYKRDERGTRLTKKGMRVANLIWEELL